MAERLQGGRLAARAIAAAGVDTIFTLSGGHVMPIYEGSRHEGVRVVDVRHEQSAAHAAEAWGRVRRRTGVALVTAGPGVTGTGTAVANCFAAQTPMVVLGGARPLAQAEWGALQEFDQLSLMKPITKWAAVCPEVDRIPEYVAIAFRQALAAPRGPVYLELPAVGETVDAGTVIGEIESTKSVSELFSPVSGTVVEVNTAAVDDPSVVNADPFGAGWLLKVDVTGAGGREFDASLRY